jgi:hypothetical protein
MAWKGNGMGAAWERRGMCELAFIPFHLQAAFSYIFNVSSNNITHLGLTVVLDIFARFLSILELIGRFL